MRSRWQDRLYPYAAKTLPNIKKHYIILSCLLISFGYLALGVIGLILSFWTMLTWFSLWRRPYRFELLLIAVLGLLGALVNLPLATWFACNFYFMVTFVGLALSPLFELILKLIRPIAID